MKIWLTELTAIDPITGRLKKWCGDEVKAPTQQLAEEWCQLNGKGYLKVVGELIAEIPCKEGTYEPDFKNMVNYENLN